MNKRIFTTISILVIFLNSCNIGDDYKPISHLEFLKTHRYNIGQTTLELNDEERNRPIKVEIWYPTKDTLKSNGTLQYPFKLPPTSRDADIVPENFPLILLSHGTGGNRISQMWLASELVGNGNIVVAVDHYGNTLDNKIPENFVKIWDRPMDISFTLDKILGNPKFQSSIDSTKIGMAGFSLGGHTTIALAGGIIDYNLLKEFSTTVEGKNEFDLPELGDVSQFVTPSIIEMGNKKYKNLKDSRIIAFLAMAPALGQGFSQESQFIAIENPLLIIGAANDLLTPVKTNAKHYNNLIANSQYFQLEGNVGHYIFMNEAQNGLKRNAPIVFKDDKNVDRKELHNKISKMAIEFFSKELK